MTIVSGYSGPTRSLSERAIAAARLDSGAYEEVEADSNATGQAALIVLFSATAQGLAAIHHGRAGIIGSICGALIGWVIWSAVTYIVGSTLFKGTATMGELMRTLGFAQAPGVLYVLRLVPVIGWLIAPFISLWILVAGIIAIRQALDFSTWKAIVTAFIGWLCLIIPLVVFGGAALVAFGR